MRDDIIYTFDLELNKTEKQINRAVIRLNILRGTYKGLLRAKIVAQKEKERQKQEEEEQNRQIDEL